MCVSPNSQFPRVSLVLDTGVKRQEVHPRIPLFNEVERPGHQIAFPPPKKYLLKQFQEAGMRRNLPERSFSASAAKLILALGFQKFSLGPCNWRCQRPSHPSPSSSLKKPFQTWLQSFNPELSGAQDRGTSISHSPLGIFLP